MQRALGPLHAFFHLLPAFPVGRPVGTTCEEKGVEGGRPGVARVGRVEGARGRPAGALPAPTPGCHPASDDLHTPGQGPWHPDLHSDPRTEVLGRLRSVCLQGP